MYCVSDRVTDQRSVVARKSRQSTASLRKDSLTGLNAGLFDSSMLMLFVLVIVSKCCRNVSSTATSLNFSTQKTVIFLNAVAALRLCQSVGPAVSGSQLVIGKSIQIS